MSADKIRELNDTFRTSMTGGRIVVTAGVDALPSDVKAMVIRKVATFADFTADKLKVFPSKVEPGADHATVRTEIKRDSGDRIAVNYVLHKTPEGWKAYDVNIDGISYVKSYREDFGSQIQQQGIDSVIARLEKGEKPSEISKTTKATGSKS